MGIVSPLRKIPQGDTVKKILIDVAHTHAIQGYGKDDCASAICFLAIHCQYWGAAVIATQLDRAFDSFKAYCVRNGKTTSLTDFSYQTMKVKSSLDFMRICWNLEQLLNHLL